MSDTTTPVCALCGADAVLVWLKFSDSTNASVENVFSCAAHQINSSIAPMTHQSTCTAPNASNLPNCDCSPVSIAVALGSSDVLPQTAKAP